MKLTRKEFEDQLKLAKSLTGDARSTMLSSLKAAQVVEVKQVDGKDIETAVTVEIVETTETKAAVADAAQATKGITAEEVTSLVTKALEEHAKKTGPVTKVGANGEPNEKGAKFTIPAEIKRFRPANFLAKAIGGLEADERAFRFGMWLLAAKGSPAAREFCGKHGIHVVEQKFSDELLQKLHSEGTNTSGGYLVPEEFSADIIDLKETYGVVRRLFGMEPMMSDTKTFPRRTAGLTAFAVAEGAAGTESTGSWDQVRLTAKDWMVLTRMTNQVSADSIINLADKLAYEIAYAHTLKEDQTGLTGTATSTYAGITGVVQALTNKWTASVAGTATGITKASSTTLASLALADFDNAVGSLPQYADTPNACWVMHRAIYYGIVEKLVQASGGVPAYEVREGNRKPRPLFKGYPVEFAQVLPSATAATTVFCLLGDFKLGASFGDRQQDQIAFSTEASVGSQSVFERNETAVRGIARWDINVHDVGDGTTPGPIVAVATG